MGRYWNLLVVSIILASASMLGVAAVTEERSDQRIVASINDAFFGQAKTFTVIEPGPEPRKDLAAAYEAAIASGRPERAAQMERAILETPATQLGVATGEALDLKAAIAGALAKRGDFQAAAEAYRALIGEITVYDGERSIETIAPLLALAKLDAKSGKPGLARQEVDQAMATAEAVYGWRAPELGDVYLEAARIYGVGLEDEARAAAFLDRVIAIEEEFTAQSAQNQTLEKYGQSDGR